MIINMEEPPLLTSPFEQAVLPKEERISNHIYPPHLHLPHLSFTNTHSSHVQHSLSDDRHVETNDCPEHPLIIRARQKVKQSHKSSPHLTDDEYIFPRFSVNELQLGKVLGRGGFGTVLAVDKFLIREENEDASNRRGSFPSIGNAIFGQKQQQQQHYRNNKDMEGEHHVRQVKSLDALGEQDVTSTIPSTSFLQEDTQKSKRKRRSVSLGFGQRHDFFRRGAKRGFGAGSIVGKENVDHQQKEGEEDPHERNTVTEERELEATGANATASVETSSLEGKESSIPKRPLLEEAKQRPSRNFSFVSWRDSMPGQEGCDAIDESDLRFLNGVVVQDNKIHHILVAPNIEESALDESKTAERKGLQENNAEKKAQADTPVKNSESTNNSTKNKADENNGMSPSKHRRIILFSNNHNTSNNTIDLNSSLRPNILQDKQFLCQHVTTSKGKARYVIKIISPHIVSGDFRKYLQAAADMANETYFLSVLNHKNILKLRAVGQGDMFSPGYFLVLDRLYDTLKERMEGVWRVKGDHLDNDFFVWNRQRKLKELWEERVGVCRDLAGALGYLHDMGIIYRDLKPDNVGFDSRDCAKLFDFGLAKQVRREDAKDGTWRLTANTGSLRYMAPEVGNGWPYNFKADSYSFTILLWEILALEVPFNHYTMQEIVNMVRKWGERPKLKDDWSDRIKENMTNGWDSNFRKRPTMKDFEVILDLELHDSQTV